MRRSGEWVRVHFPLSIIHVPIFSTHRTPGKACASVYPVRIRRLLTFVGSLPPFIRSSLHSQLPVWHVFPITQAPFPFAAYAVTRIAQMTCELLIHLGTRIAVQAARN